MCYLKPTNDDLDKLFNWILNFGHFKLDNTVMNDYKVFRDKLRKAHYSRFHGHVSNEIFVTFNSPCDGNKTVFKFGDDSKFKICDFEKIVKHSWNRLKKGNTFQQLSLF